MGNPLIPPETQDARCVECCDAVIANAEGKIIGYAWVLDETLITVHWTKTHSRVAVCGKEIV